MENQTEQIVGKKINFFNIFAFIMVAVMCVVSVAFTYIASQNNSDGQDGLSVYELAIKNGIISSDVTEFEYLMSLYGEDGEDGTNVTLQDVYEAYLEATGYSSSDYSLSQFVLEYYPDKILDGTETVELVESSTASALCSTVDICYSYYMDTSTIYVTESNGYYYIDSSYTDKYVAIGVAAGSGVIYYIDDNVAYIITNYHVVYCENYTNSSDYRVYYNETTGEYFNAPYEESDWTTSTTTNNTPWGSTTTTRQYISTSDLEEAPLSTHFASSYGVYVYGYQSSKYEITAEFVGGSSDNDIAVLKVTKSASTNNSLLFNGSYRAVTLGNSSDLNEGETVIAVGNPLLVSSASYDNSSTEAYVASIKATYVDSLCLSATTGNVSLVSEYCDFTSIVDSSETISMRLIRTSAAINSGNSGGGLYDAYGRLVGIVNGKIADEDYDNVGYAIPVNIAAAIADQIIATCDGTTTISISALTSSSLGITLEDEEIAHSYYDDTSLLWVTDNDVVIASVSGVAETYGFEANDIIVSITIKETDEDEGKTYELNFNYELNDILLNVLSTSYSVTFNLERSGYDTYITILVSDITSYFVSIT